MVIRITEPYRVRPIRCLGIWESQGWRLKVYGAAYDGDGPPTQLVEAAKELAVRQLPSMSGDQNPYGVGFLCAHAGRGGNYVFIDWWADENELHHRIFTSREDRAADLSPVAPEGLTACVWDLAIMSFERQAWLEAVLTNPDGPDLDRYLESQLNADI